MLRLTAVLLTLSSIGLAPGAAAAPVYVEASFTVTSGPPGEIPNGNVYQISFTFDDSATDSDGSTTLGIFSVPMQDLSLIRLSGSGSWDAAAATFDAVHSVTTDAALGQLLFAIGFANGPDVGGDPLHNMLLTVNTLITDTGSGQTVRDQVGGLLGSGLTGNGQIDTINGPAVTFSIASFEATEIVPEPATWTMGIAGLSLLATVRAYRRQPGQKA